VQVAGAAVCNRRYTVRILKYHLVHERILPNYLLTIYGSRGRAIAEAVIRWLPNAAARVRAWHVGFVVQKLASGKVFSKYFGFPC
jgi:hypothetical protein